MERLSIELTNRCDKHCSFCYNRSGPSGETRWTAQEVVDLVRDCVRHGTQAVSLGGGEPLLFAELTEVLTALRGHVFRSVTTNGLLLMEDAHFSKLLAARPEKVHVSIHRPAVTSEVERVTATVKKLEEAGIASGVNLLVPADQAAAAARTAQALHKAGIDNRRIIYLPQRRGNTPTPKMLAEIARAPFQSMSCLNACGKSSRFCAIAWDKSVAWCSYTVARQPLPGLSHDGLSRALSSLALVPCSAAR